jgi:hypothetical protein
VIAPFDDDGSVAVVMITVADDVTVTVTVTVTVVVPVTIVTLTNRYANRTNANPDLFRSGRQCAANSNDGGDYDSILYHCVLLSLLNSGKAIPGRRDRSAMTTEPRLRGAHCGLE